ncbi:MAG TPA: CBS domain-containing protein [Terriglobales bacterium]|jgi:CBS domain-containing protein|nr:CBS domain-containing protein [Terriglobales bacterium]
MKIREVMTAKPVCCLPGDTAQRVAQIMRDQNVGSVPVVADYESRKLVGMITDRDLCCAVVAEGVDPKNTEISRFVSTDIVTCRDGENLDNCERLMQQHQLRRIPVVDGEGRCIGIVAQADLALKDKPEKVSKTVGEISKPGSASPIAA